MNLNFKLIRKTECNRLTWLARLFLLLIIVAGFSFFFLRIPSFLSKSNPVQGDILVLDGHLPDYVIKEAIKIFDSGSYSHLVVSGGDLQSGYYISDIKSMAELSYATFIELGFDSTRITAIPTGNVWQNRTYTSALAFRNWLVKNNYTSGKIDVVAIGFHARRSQYLFNLALEPDYEVGVISVQDLSFDNIHWSKSSKGTRTVISEIIGYFYSLLFVSAD